MVGGVIRGAGRFAVGFAAGASDTRGGSAEEASRLTDDHVAGRRDRCALCLPPCVRLSFAFGLAVPVEDHAAVALNRA